MYDLFSTDSGNAKGMLYKGNPATADRVNACNSCLAIKVDNGLSGGNLSRINLLYIDPTETYQFKASYYSASSATVTLGRYANSGSIPNLKDCAGRFWQYSLGFKCPVDKCNETSTTAGPIGSKAQFRWPNDATSLGLTCWIGGDGSTVDIDDLIFEVIDLK